ncbi:DUF6531 domain-containing protein [Pseudidiomarina sp.]|uniref:DUF6531 domain-containing protein n=1 Tax=Pseudidiomarina sp. TaxID=2081707 RepID=UPI00299DAD03|nr:DUF6531 domain-containing protein [Pseudidiomarina sp.]MDX1705555.1 DUF6531 domain-containing protein [Pseudidiomarina sp.]
MSSKKGFILLLFIANFGTALFSVPQALAEEEVPEERIQVTAPRLKPEPIIVFNSFWMIDLQASIGSDVANVNTYIEEQKEDSCRAGNPVIVSSGEKVESITDVVLKGQLPFSLTRDYSSLNSHIGAFGPGWHQLWI